MGKIHNQYSPSFKVKVTLQAIGFVKKGAKNRAGGGDKINKIK